MPASQRRSAQGAHQGRQLLQALGRELREARRAAGISQAAVGRAIGVSGTHIGRLERAAVPSASIVLFARVFAVVGMRLTARAFPAGPPLRDAGHARLLSRLRARLGPAIRLRTEVPVRGPLELRAWDAELVTADDTCKVEAETVLHDLQALDRRLALKMADDAVDRVILLVADTQHNRRVLREFEGLLSGRFPLKTREILRELSAGRLPHASGVVVL